MPTRAASDVAAVSPHCTHADWPESKYRDPSGTPFVFAHAVVLGEDASGQRLRSELLSFVRQYPGTKGSRARVDPDPLHSDPIGHGLQVTLPRAGFDARRALARLGILGALLARTSRNSVHGWLVGVDSTRNRQASATPCHARRHAGAGYASVHACVQGLMLGCTVTRRAVDLGCYLNLHDPGAPRDSEFDAERRPEIRTRQCVVD
eukprot:scaffold4174_cov66-Phaeocystis_antarctica.AAC.3